MKLLIILLICSISMVYGWTEMNRGVEWVAGKDCRGLRGSERVQCNSQFRTFKKLLSGMYFPHNVPLALGSEALPEIFNPNIRCLYDEGYITPLSGVENCTDWLYSYPGHLNTTGAITGVRIFHYETKGDEVDVGLIAMSEFLNYPVYYAQIILKFKFDEYSNILAYNFKHPKYNQAFADSGYPTNTAEGQYFQQLDACFIHSGGCLGDYQEYDDDAHCMSFLGALTAEGRHGTPDDYSQNSTICRLVHSYFAWSRPTHCSHMGPNGGGKCLDFDYRTEIIQKPEFLFPYMTEAEIEVFTLDDAVCGYTKGTEDELNGHTYTTMPEYIANREGLLYLASIWQP